MRRITLTLLATSMLAATAACSSGGSPTRTAAAPAAATPSATAVAPVPSKAAAATADAALAAIAKKVPSAVKPSVVTDANDRNHLLGRPNQYTSKVTFTDSRIKDSDVEMLGQDDVERGGAIEVFATADDAKRRADYIQGIVKSMPTLLEYDYPHGPVLVRVSRFLTPAQASEYDKAAS